MAWATIKPVFILFLAILAAGCAPSRVEEGEEGLAYHVGMARAYYRLSDYPRAVEMYSKALELNPGDAEVCLQLGILYEDNLKDLGKASAYYREFLRLSPASEKTALVREWLARTEKDSNGSPAPALEPVRLPPASLSAAPPAPRSPAPPRSPVSPAATGPAPTPGPRPPAPSKPASADMVRYTVARGDTLAGIADRFYGNRSLWKPILDANRETLQSPEKLRVGQVLLIPSR